MRRPGLIPLLFSLVLTAARADAPAAAPAAVTVPAAATVAGPVTVGPPRTGQFVTAFTLTTPLADAREVAQRLLHRIVFENALKAGEIGSGQTVDPTRETWQMYVPEDYDGSQAYGVLVYVDPRPVAWVPYGWEGQLKAHKLIFVAANKSGNRESVDGRRIPLALTGLVNVEARYRIDPARMYVAGFSGGGVTASRIAAAYSDVFTGAIYISTSDGLGSPEVPVPPKERYQLMQDRGRYVFTNGTEETTNQIMNGRSFGEYKSLCVLHVYRIEIPDVVHEDLPPRPFARALKYLDDPDKVDPADQASCEQRLAERRAASLKEIRQAFADDDTAKAHDLLVDFHQQFGFMGEPDFSHFAGCLNGAILAMDCLPALKKPDD